MSIFIVYRKRRKEEKHDEDNISTMHLQNNVPMSALQPVTPSGDTLHQYGSNIVDLQNNYYIESNSPSLDTLSWFADKSKSNSPSI